MGEKRNKPTVLSEKQQQTLIHLYLCAASTMEQINRDVFGNVSPTFVYRKMRDLINAGLVEKRFFSGTRNIRGAYLLADKGLKYLVGKNSKESMGGKVRPQSLAHDLALVDIRHAFLKLEAVKNYFTENAIQSGNHAEIEGLQEIARLHPDAVVELARDGESYLFAIEYESHCKFLTKRKDKIGRYYGDDLLSGAIFICRERQTLERFLSLERNLKSQYQANIFYGLLEDVQNAIGYMTFSSKNDAKMTIGKKPSKEFSNRSEVVQPLNES